MKPAPNMFLLEVLHCRQAFHRSRRSLSYKNLSSTTRRRRGWMEEKSLFNVMGPLETTKVIGINLRQSSEGNWSLLLGGREGVQFHCSPGQGLSSGLFIRTVKLHSAQSNVRNRMKSILFWISFVSNGRWLCRLHFQW